MVVVTFLSLTLLKERVTFIKIFSVTLCIVGVTLVSIYRDQCYSLYSGCNTSEYL